MSAVHDAIRSIDEDSGPISEIDIHSSIIACRQGAKMEDGDLPFEYHAEVLAFSFSEHHAGGKSPWGTFYGPMTIWLMSDGTETETPSLSDITVEMIEYWERRASAAKHPVLRARYSGLVWDLAQKAIAKAPPIKCARIFVDSAIEMADRQSHKRANEIILKLKKATNIALSIKDTERQRKITHAVISYEDRVAEDSKAGSWGFSFDLLLEQKKVHLTDQQEQKIISDLENRLTRLCIVNDDMKFSSFGAQYAAARLARYFRRTGDMSSAHRVLGMYGAAFEKVSANASGIQAMSWLRVVHGLYLEYGMINDANRVAVQMRKLGSKAYSEMRPISHEIKISKKDMDLYIQEMTSGTLDDVLRRIALRYIPDRKQAIEQVKKLAEDAPLTMRIPQQIPDHHGRPVAQIGSVDDDLDGHVILTISQNMQTSALFLRNVIEATFKKFDVKTECLTEYLCRSSILLEEKRGIIDAGIKAYCEGNGLCAVHLLIPQIEDAVRTLAEEMEIEVLKKGRHGELQLRTLYDLLSDPRLISFFGENVAMYLQVLLVDPRGLNLRNNICHGLLPSNVIWMCMADRILHVLLILALVRISVETNPEVDSPET